MEAECTAGGAWNCVPGGAFLACVWEFEGVKRARYMKFGRVHVAKEGNCGIF